MTTDNSHTKSELRSHLRALRQAHVEALPGSTKGLLFRVPPAPLLNLVPSGSAIGVYHANQWEAPAQHYASHFAEKGHSIALPRFADNAAAMEFAQWTDFYGETDLEDGAFGIKQPSSDAPKISPDVLFVPLIGFSENGERLGQGGGHYDRWLADNPDKTDREFFRVGVDIQDKYTEKAGGKKIKYLGAGAWQWERNV